MVADDRQHAHLREGEPDLLEGAVEQEAHLLVGDGDRRDDLGACGRDPEVGEALAHLRGEETAAGVALEPEDGWARAGRRGGGAGDRVRHAHIVRGNLVRDHTM